MIITVEEKPYGVRAHTPGRRDFFETDYSNIRSTAEYLLIKAVKTLFRITSRRVFFKAKWTGTERI